jgi:hypothetical protein
MDKIAEAEVLVDMILEQGFSVNVALSNLNGNAEVDWSNCYSRRCKTQQNEFDRNECKADCQGRAFNQLTSRINALRSRCRQSQNPDGCIKTIANAVQMTRDKQRKVRDQIAKIRASRAEFARKEAARR